MAGIQVDKDALREKAAEIANLDATLDAQSGSKSAGKRAVINSLVNSSANNEFVESVVQKLSDFSEEELYATFHALVSGLENEFQDSADQFIETEVEKKSEEQAEKLSDEEIQQVSEERKEKVQEFKALKNILEMFGQDVDDIPDPKTRRGSRGPRGPRTLSKFQYRINETDLEPEVNSLATVAKLSGNVKVKDLKEHITEQGVDLKNPPANWEAELPNGVGTLYASPLPEYEDEFSDSDEEEAA